MGTRVKQALLANLFERTAAYGGSLQERVRRMLVAAILEERYPVGQPLPSSRDLAAELGLSRNTVILAYQQLTEEGYITSQERRGHFVSSTVLARAPSRQATTAASDAKTCVDWLSRVKLQPSKLPKIDKPRDWQRYAYPFLYGQFDPQLFPVAEWRECSRSALSLLEMRGWASDLIDRDDPLLIEQLQLHVLARRGVWARPEEIMITLGAQHALFILAELLFGAGTVMGMEDPGYGEARNIFVLRGARVLRLPLDSHGVVLGETLSHCDYVYVTPSHQCPTTVAMPMDRKVGLLARAARDDFIVIEDDYEPHTGVDEHPTPALKSLDTTGHVVYVGSLSKTIAPGLRLGFVVGPSELILEARAVRRLMVRHPAANNQRAAGLFLSLGHYEVLQRRLQHSVRQRAEVLVQALAKHLPECHVTLHRDSSSAWVAGPAWLDTRALTLAAKKRGVLIEPGHVFFIAKQPPVNYFRLGFSSIPVDRIEDGIRELAAALMEVTPRREVLGSIDRSAGPMSDLAMRGVERVAVPWKGKA